jgi:hypothetical protein
MLKADSVNEVLSTVHFSENQLQFIHPDEMSKYMNELSRIPGITIQKIGSSREGREIFAIEIGTGDKHVFAIGGAHADEPTGTVTLVHLARELAKLKKSITEYTFFFIPQLDPDGAALNWQWMKEPYFYKNFARFNYRNNNPENDVEHGIPILEEQTMRQEVEAFKTFIDGIGKIDYYITLHTTHLLGGALFVVCLQDMNQTKTIINFLTTQCRNHGIEMMDIELYGQMGIERLAPGFITAPRVEDFQKFYKDHPDILKKIKMNTYQYALERCGAKLSLISELPFLVDPELNNTEETKMSRYDLEMEDIRRGEKLLEQRRKLWDKLKGYPQTEDSQFWSHYYEFMLEMAPQGIEAQRADADRYKGKYAKMCELTELNTQPFTAHYSLGLMGMRRLAGLKTKDAVSQYKKYETMFEQGWAEYEKRISYWLLPLAEQVKLQSAMILAGLLIV